MGGAITVKSVAGAGSTVDFTVRFDAAPPAASASADTEQDRETTNTEIGLPIARPGSDGAPPYILVAEDNLVNQTIAARLLERQGFQVELARDGCEAVEKFRRKAFEAILMDVQMPEMDGFQATRAIRQIESAAGGHVPIIAMTAHAMKGDRERCLSGGMDAYISKPIRPAELVAAIRSLTFAASASRPHP